MSPATLRVLDPSTAEPLSSGRAPRPVGYLGDRLLVRGLPGLSQIAPMDLLRKVAEEQGILVAEDEQTLQKLPELGRFAQTLDRVWTTSVRLIRPDGPPPDAWPLLLATRRADPEVARGIQLDHVMALISH